MPVIEENEGTYFGNVRIHFQSGNNLELEITNLEYDHFFDRFLNSQNPKYDGLDFYEIMTLCNQLIFLNIGEIQDIHFDHWNEDEMDVFYAHEEYPPNIDLPSKCDPRIFRSWDLVEQVINYQNYNDDPDSWSDEQVKIMYDHIRHDSEDKLKDIESFSSDEDKEKRIKYYKDLEQEFSNRVNNIEWKTKSGKHRKTYIEFEDGVRELISLYVSFYALSENIIDKFLIFKISECGEVIINTSFLDYISIPLHKYKAGCDLSLKEDELEFQDDE